MNCAYVEALCLGLGKGPVKYVMLELSLIWNPVSVPKDIVAERYVPSQTPEIPTRHVYLPSLLYKLLPSYSNT